MRAPGKPHGKDVAGRICVGRGIRKCPRWRGSVRADRYQITNGLLFEYDDNSFSGRKCDKCVSIIWSVAQMRMVQLLRLGSIIMDIEDRLKLMPKKPRAPSNLGVFPYDGNVIGGALIGVGMAMTGACPGTSLVQMGTGNVNGVLVVIGGVLGATAFVKLQPSLKSVRTWFSEVDSATGDSSTTETKGPLDIASALGIHPITLLLVWVPMCAAVILLAYAKDNTTHTVPVSGLVRPAYGGLLIGLAQLATTLLTGHAVGASAAYQDVATWIDRRLLCQSEDRSQTALLTPSLIFSGGVVAAAAALNLMVPKIGNASLNSRSMLHPRYVGMTIIGGASMVFGARLAGGCTSGHGISGLAKFSLASLATTAAMFTAGIVTACAAA